MTRSAIDLILPIRGSTGLDTQSDKRLISWLLNRTITVGGSGYQIPFDEFEGWIEEHGEHLVNDLDDQYAEILAVELQSNSTPLFDVDAALSRIKTVFISLYQRGGAYRAILWRLLIRYVALDNKSAAQLGWNTARVSLASVDESDISEFVSAFADRLTKDTQNDDENWELDIESANEALLSVLSEKLSELNETTRLKISDLCMLWSVDGVNVTASISIAELLDEEDHQFAAPVFSDWTNRLFTDLPEPCVKVIAQKLPSLLDDARNNISSQLSSIASSTKFDDNTKDKYQIFFKAMPAKSKEDELTIGHLREVWPQIAAHHANQNNFLTKVFPVISRLIENSPEDVLGNALHTLFENSKSQPSHYSFLHSWMANQWPVQNDNLQPYNPEQIFTDALEFSSNQTGSPRAGLLRSMVSMIDKGIVDEARTGDVITAACAVWAASPKDATYVFTHGFGELEASQIASLIDGFDWEVEDNPGYLSSTFQAITASISTEIEIEATLLILNKGVSGNTERPDYALDLWVDSLGDDLQPVIESTISSADVSDEHRKRLWAQIQKFEETKDPDFIVDLLPKVLVLPDGETTAQAILGDIPKLKGLLKSKDYQAGLARCLMNSYADYPSKTVKSAVTAACKELSGEAGLSHLVVENLSDTDFEILQAHYSDSKALRKILKERKMEN